MVLNVLITSKEMIKPSSPTPHHLRTFKLSFLDHISPPIFIPLVFFYQKSDHHFPSSHSLLKQSLSDVLTQYYPLAGRLSSDHVTVDCNDSGALFVEAKVHANLMEMVTKPSMDEIKEFLPLGPSISTECNSAEDDGSITLALQITVFDCGGIAISVQMCHNVGDGTSLVNFMNAWAATCRSDDTAKLKFSPIFEFSNVFASKVSRDSSKPFAEAISKEKIITKRLVFDKEKIAKLKMEEVSLASKSSLQELAKINPTRVEVVTSFLWRQYIDIAKGKDSKKTITACHCVNLRPRMDPILSNRVFGNVIIMSALARPSIVVAEAGDERADGLNLVNNISNVIRRVDADYVKKLESGDGYLSYLKEVVAQAFKGEIELCPFTSWCRFPVYEVDYGWGKPVWVCTYTLPYKNTVVLMSTSCGEGIEAWVNVLEEDEMKLPKEFMD